MLILKTNYALTGNNYDAFLIENGKVVDVNFSFIKKGNIETLSKITPLFSVVKSEYDFLRKIENNAYLFLNFGDSSYYVLKDELHLYGLQLDAIQPYKKHFYEALPDTFQRKDILNLAKKYNITNPTLGRFLANKALFGKVAFGHYKKLF